MPRQQAELGMGHVTLKARERKIAFIIYRQMPIVATYNAYIA